VGVTVRALALTPGKKGRSPPGEPVSRARFLFFCRLRRILGTLTPFLELRFS